MTNDVGTRLAPRGIALLLGACALVACGADTPTPALPGLPGGNDAGFTGGMGGTGGLDAMIAPSVIPPPERPDATIVGPEEACYSRRIDALARKPDILIVLDRSFSMLDGNRWDPSRNAVKSITQQFQSTIDFGLAMFPGTGGDDCTAGRVDVAFQSNNAAPIAAAIDGAAPLGFTPLGATLEALAGVITDRTPQLDTAVKPAYVLLVTDGAPTCELDGGWITASPTSINRANAAVERLKAQNVPTYVIGYDVASAAAVMDGLAQRGGTERYYPVENEAQLVEQFKKITAGLASCEYQLEAVPDSPDRVKVVIDGVQIYLNDALARGWVLDGKTIRLQQGACDSIRDGAQHNLDVSVECTPVLPPG
jgi:uncharacterized protein YegL